MSDLKSVVQVLSSKRADGDCGLWAGALSTVGTEGSGLRAGALSTVGTAGVPVLRFALARAALPGFVAVAGDEPSRRVEVSLPSGDPTRSIARAMLSLADRMEREAAAAGVFLRPFLAGYVLRLADGSRVLPSPTVLMIPTSGAPVVRLDGAVVADSVLTATAALSLVPCRLCISADPAAWRPLLGIVESVEIFISPQAATYTRGLDGGVLAKSATAPFTHSGVLTDGGFATHCEQPSLSMRGADNVWIFPAETTAKGVGSLLDRHIFHIAASVTVEELCGGQAGFRTVDLHPMCVELPESMPALIPDYAGWRSLPAGVGIPEEIFAAYRRDSSGEDTGLSRARWIFAPAARDVAGMTRHAKLDGSYWFAGLSAASGSWTAPKPAGPDGDGSGSGEGTAATAAIALTAGGDGNERRIRGVMLLGTADAAAWRLTLQSSTDLAVWTTVAAGRSPLRLSGLRRAPFWRLLLSAAGGAEPEAPTALRISYLK